MPNWSPTDLPNTGLQMTTPPSLEKQPRPFYRCDIETAIEGEMPIEEMNDDAVNGSGRKQHGVLHRAYLQCVPAECVGAGGNSPQLLQSATDKNGLPTKPTPQSSPEQRKSTKTNKTAEFDSSKLTAVANNLVDQPAPMSTGGKPIAVGC